jgi:hypothetical protein
MLNARALQEADHGTPLEVLPPVLFNTFKHHAGALRVRIDEIAAAGPGALAELGTRLAVLGSRLMDLYTGPLSPRDLSAWVVQHLQAEGRLELSAYRAWLLTQNDYAVVDNPQEGSRWVLRLGDETGRYVHLHPARWSPLSVRVRANVLKTAFLGVAHARVHGGDPSDRVVLNEVRRDYLGLSPLGQDPEGDAGLGIILELLSKGD